MKKIYFQLGGMYVGGVEKAFLGLLTTLPRNEYEVHVGFIGSSDGYIKMLPEYVNVHWVDCYKPMKSLINDPPLYSVRNLLKLGHVFDAIVYFLLSVHYKMTKGRYWFYQYMMRNVPVESEQYDIAVAFAGPSQMIDYYVCKKIRAKKKYGWIHFDVTKFGIDVPMTRKLYRVYEKIFIVSETAKEKFDGMFPEFKKKTVVRYNVVPHEQIVRLADDGDSFNDDFKGKRILTVGRISTEKGQDVAIDALKILLDRGFDVRWYFIGEGVSLQSCKDKVERLGLTDNVRFLGVRLNPYPYMKDCDIYVQPSRHEGYCITLAEARCFAAPIVATCFTGAEEQLKTFPKSVVTGMSAEDMANGIQSYLI